jgi:hypothetical protein
MGIQGDGPFFHARLDLASAPEPAAYEIRADFAAQLSPHFIFAGSEYLSENSHFDQISFLDTVASSFEAAARLDLSRPKIQVSLYGFVSRWISGSATCVDCVLLFSSTYLLAYVERAKSQKVPMKYHLPIKATPLSGGNWKKRIRIKMMPSITRIPEKNACASHLGNENWRSLVHSPGGYVKNAETKMHRLPKHLNVDS